MIMVELKWLYDFHIMLRNIFSFFLPLSYTPKNMTNHPSVEDTTPPVFPANLDTSIILHEATAEMRAIVIYITNRSYIAC